MLRSFNVAYPGIVLDLTLDDRVVDVVRENFDAAVDGLGIAFAIKEAVATHIAEARLVPLLQKWSAPYPGFYLCYPAQRQMPPALRAFIDHVRV